MRVTVIQYEYYPYPAIQHQWHEQYNESDLTVYQYSCEVPGSVSSTWKTENQARLVLRWTKVEEAFHYTAQDRKCQVPPAATHADVAQFSRTARATIEDRLLQRACQLRFSSYGQEEQSLLSQE
jgi:hypothetical protein